MKRALLLSPLLSIPAACHSAAPTHPAAAAAPVSAVAHAPRGEVVEDFASLVPAAESAPGTYRDVDLERVTSAVPWGRGITMVDGELIVLSRGRHRRNGGVSQSLVDHAGTLWKVDLSGAEPVVPGQLAGAAVRDNATSWIRPTSPPFHLYDYQRPPEEDLRMGRPYCALAFDAPTQSFYVCTYSGAELPTGFRKHASDAVYRYDLRDRSWHVVEQHDPDSVPTEALGAVISNEYYPHHDPATNPAPHGWGNGPDGCTVAGEYLYIPSKDNHLVTQYDLAEIRRDASAGPPESRPVLGPSVLLRHPGGTRRVEVLGASGVATTDEHLYVSYRTSSVVIRIPLEDDGDLRRNADGEVEAELIAVFEPWRSETGKSGNLYDISISPEGELFVSMGRAGRIWRIRPDPQRPFYGDDTTDRPTTAAPFVDLSVELGKKAGCNNIYAGPDGYLYISSRTDDTGEGRYNGTIYRVRCDAGPQRVASLDATHPTGTW